MSGPVWLASDGAARKPIWVAASSNAVIAPKSIEYAVCAGARAGKRTMAATSSGMAAERMRGLQNESQERSEEHTSELQSHHDLVCRLLLEKKNKHTDT